MKTLLALIIGVPYSIFLWGNLLDPINPLKRWKKVLIILSIPLVFILGMIIDSI